MKRTLVSTLAALILPFAGPGANGQAHIDQTSETHMEKLVFVLRVRDERRYADYRAKIAPIMERLGIVVLNEYRISEVVHSKKPEDSVNLIAMFGFPSAEAKRAFFSDPEYVAAKTLFDASTTNFVKLVE